MCQMTMDDKPGGTSLLSLDAEVLDLVLCQLSAKETVFLAATCTQLSQLTRSGSHAAHRWREHCTDLLGPIVVGHVAAAQQTEEGSPWHRLYASSKHLDTVHWSSAKLEQLTGTEHKFKTHRTAARQLARFGHTATVAGSLLVLLGGVTRDGPVSTLDVSVLDLASNRLAAPQLTGQQPPALRHLSTAVVTLEQGSLLHSKVLEAVQSQQQQQRSTPPQQQKQQQGTDHGSIDVITEGYTLVTFGGLAPGDAAVGGRQLYILWLAADATWGVWLRVDTTGHPPEPRAYACCQPINNNSQLLVYGGWANGTIEGTIGADVCELDGFLLLCVYLFDVNNLAWLRKPTWPLNEPPKPGHVMIGPSTCPGPRKQAMCCRRVNPATGHEEFVVLGGCGSDGLASCVPYALDLETFVWMKGPVMGYLPTARDAAAYMQITDEWLLLIGGKGPQGEPLSDVQRLHLPSLSWRPPPLVYDNSSGGSSSSTGAVAARLPGKDTVDFTATAGVVVGGCREGPYGTMVIPRIELLLPGPPMACSRKQQLAAAADANAEGYFHRHHHQQQQGPGIYGGCGKTALGDGCRCGSCCSCMARKAAAAPGACGGLVSPGSCMTRPCQPGTDHSWTAALAAREQRQRQQQQQQQDPSPRNPLNTRTAAAGGTSSDGSSSNSSPRHDRNSGLDPSNLDSLRGFPATGGLGWGLDGGVNSGFSSGGACGQQAPHGKLSHYGGWENEIEPAADQPAPKQQCLAAAVTAPGYQGLGSGLINPGWPATAAGTVGSSQQQEAQHWQAPHKSILGGMALAQILAAAGVLLIGLLLVYPSMLLQEVAGEKQQPDGDAQL